jgi:DNA replication protein DnaC
VNTYHLLMFFASPYERDPVGSIVFFQDWPELFVGDEVPATEILDRLFHRSHVFNIRGRSYRLREPERAAEAVR